MRAVMSDDRTQALIRSAVSANTLSPTLWPE